MDNDAEIWWKVQKRCEWSRHMVEGKRVLDGAECGWYREVMEGTEKLWYRDELEGNDFRG